MHGSFDHSRGSDRLIHRNWGIALCAVPALLAIVLSGMVIAYPAVSTWVSRAAQAEFAGAEVVPNAAPTRLARPAMEIRTVRAN